MAVQDLDDPSRWSVRVPVATPSDVVLDAANDRALVVDSDLDALLAVDLASGDRTILSDSSTGTGTDFLVPFSVAVDAANNRALVIDRGFDALFVVELGSGERAIASK